MKTSRSYVSISGEVRTYNYTYSKYRPKALEQCRAALRRGPLISAGKHYFFKQRAFSPATVNALIASGEAERIGDRIEANQNDQREA